MNKRAMREAETLALSSTHPRARIGAVLVLRSGHRYFGFNQVKTHPLQKRFERGRPRNGLHAEVHALSVALRHHPPGEMLGATLYVARRGGLMCKPCESCSAALEYYGVSTIFYTRDGVWVTPMLSFCNEVIPLAGRASTKTTL